MLLVMLLSQQETPLNETDHYFIALHPKNHSTLNLRHENYHCGREDHIRISNVRKFCCEVFKNVKNMIVLNLQILHHSSTKYPQFGGPRLLSGECPLGLHGITRKRPVLLKNGSYYILQYIKA